MTAAQTQRCPRYTEAKAVPWSSPSPRAEAAHLFLVTGKAFHQLKQTAEDKWARPAPHSHPQLRRAAPRELGSSARGGKCVQKAEVRDLSFAHGIRLNRNFWRPLIAQESVQGAKETTVRVGMGVGCGWLWWFGFSLLGFWGALSRSSSSSLGPL